MNNKPGRKNLCIFILIAAFLIFFHGFGKPHILPWQGKVTLNNPVSIEASGGRLFVVDSQSSRIVFVNCRGRVDKILAVPQLKPSFDFIKDIVADDNYLYILGCNVRDNGLQITKEHIEKYNFRGKHIKTLFEDKPESDDQRTAGRLGGLNVCKDKLFFTKISDDRKSAAAYQISAEAGADNALSVETVCEFDSIEDIMYAEYDAKNERLICTNLFNDVYVKERATDRVMQAKEEKDYFGVDSQKAQKAIKALRECPDIVAEGEELTPFSCKCCEEKGSENSGKIYFLRYRQHAISEYNPQTDKLTVCPDFPISFAERTKSIAFWLSVLLLVSALSLFVYREVKKGLSKNAKYLAAILTVSAIIIEFYNVALYSQLLEQYKMRVAALCNNVVRYTEKNADEFIYKADRSNVKKYCRGKLQRDTVATLTHDLTGIADDAGGKDSFIAELYLLGKDGKLYLLADSMRLFPAGVQLTKELTNKFLNNSPDVDFDSYKGDDISWREDEDDRGKYLTRHVTVLDNFGDVSLMVSCGCCTDNLRTRVLGKTVETFINLLAFLIVLFVSATVFGTLKEKVKLYIANKNKDNDRAAMAIAAPYAFGTYLAYSIDLVLMMLVSVQLCGGNAARLALPSLCGGLGAIFGKVALMGLHRIFKNKTVVTGAAGMLAASFAACAVAVELNNILIFSVAQFVKQLCAQGIIVTTVYKMPFSCLREDLKRDAASFFFSAKNAGTILSLLIGGFVAALFDYRAMYIVAAVIGLALSLLFAFTYTDCEKKENGTASTSLLKVFKVCFKADMFVFLALILLPKTAAVAYSEKIFPIFATMSNMSLLVVSNLTVFVKTFNYLVVARLSKNEKLLQITPVKIVAAFNILIGLLYAGIWLNGTIFWAIVILFLIDTVAELGTGFGSFYMAGIGKKYSIPGSDVIDLHEVMYGTGMFISAALLLLLVFGYENACGIIGAGYITCALLFKIIAAKNKTA